MGRLVEIVGIPFSGKTCLISQLIDEFPEFKIILFEKHFVREDIKKGYYNFYLDIRDTLTTSSVISESVYSCKNNSYYSVSDWPSLTILCEPEWNEQHRRCMDYIDKFGLVAFVQRFGEVPLNHARKWARKGLKDALIYDGTNIDEVIKAVGELECL